MTTFEYLAVFVSIVIGLAVVRLLRGLIELATGEGLESYWVHTAWLAYHVLWLPYFWWFTFGWRNQSDWTYPLFFFIVAYSMTAYAVIAALLPDTRSGVRDYEEYFYRARRPIFGLLMLVMVMDGIDSALKGPENLERLGPSYFPILGLWILGHFVASLTDSRRYHAAWVTVYFAVQTLWSMGVWAEAFGLR
jgi:hypothetical protein